MSDDQQADVPVPARYARVNAWVISGDTGRLVTRPTLLAFGERVARVRDRQGHLWWLHERVEDVPPDELANRFADPAALEAMAYVQRSLYEDMAATASRRPSP